MSITDFLLARVAEDEADIWRGAELIGADRVVGNEERDALREEEQKWEARVLAECAAKRQFVRHDLAWADENQMDIPTTSMRILATIYEDHPDFQREWRWSEVTVWDE